ncbi:DUF4263 domain-containing protein [Rhizobium laguerreae]|uniref:Shedu immune nuclease family protein n=1 Tax=Rhizobium laguerreae TaxID=1076926 RepID=UPI001C916BD7|nr:Shedu immune nuclease family protein [Rhizobium laguerreae]MBY3246009.1 DUF4263 domain-containing protein [Rhizobium laguerreae]
MADDWDGELRLIVRNLGDTINVDLQLNDRLVKSVNSLYNLADVNEPTLLFTIDLDRKVVGVFPLITYRTSNIYSQKYKKIHSIWFELPPDDWDAPTDHDSAIEFLKTYLPGGFVHDPTYGLGVTKELRPIIHAIEEIEGVSRIVIGTKETTRHEHSIFYFRESDFFNLRTVFGRTTRRHQQESLMERNILAHNNVLHNVYPDKYRLKEPPYRPGTIYKLVGGQDAAQTVLQGKDRTALLKTVVGNAAAIADRDPKEFVQLQKDLELVSLDRLIHTFEKSLGKNHNENHWQKMLELNPFILSMVFGYPIVIVQAGAAVGGGTIAGNGTKIADFLSKNSSSHNAAIVEIKTPQTPVCGKEYRGGVWKPSNHLMGAVAQVLDQRQKLTLSLPVTKQFSPGLSDLQVYAVDCVIVVGIMPAEPAQISSFEMVRSQFKDVRIVTFDELFGKLLLLREMLTGERYVSPIDDGDDDIDPMFEVDADDEGDDAYVDEEEPVSRRL